jgi:hypothetical protein
MQVAGTGHRIAADALRQAIEQSAELHRTFLRFAHAFFIQTTYTALTNEDRGAFGALSGADNSVLGEKKTQPVLRQSGQYSDTFDAYVPSLSELIGACGDSFLSLARQADCHCEVRWLACSHGLGPVSGATAVEAVARHQIRPYRLEVRFWLPAHGRRV